MPFFLTPFGIANYTGLAATCALGVLLATSNDKALRALGAARWKSIQRLNYAIAGLTIVHAVLYQVSENRGWPLIAVFAVIVAAAGGLQVAAYARRLDAGR